MTTSDLIAAVILKATGEVSTAANGDSEWSKVLGAANYYLNTWANEPGVDWNSLYTPESSLGTITATDSFLLPTTAIKVSDQAGDTVRIDYTNGTGYTIVNIVAANQLKRYYTGNKTNYSENVCAQIGRNLVFNRKFKSTDPEFGGTITAPTYAAPTSLVNPTDVVLVDDPNWLVVICAAEYVRNDITLQQQYPNLVAEANAIMTDMKTNNDTAQEQEIYRVPVGGGVTW